MRTQGSVTRRERLELVTTALIPAALGMLGSLVSLGGRLAWLLPFLVLPVGLLVARSWQQLGAGGLPSAIDRSCGEAAGRFLRGIYVLWGLWLLADTALDCTDRLLAAAQLPVGRWPLLAAALLLTLWLGTSTGRYVRTGRIFYLVTAVTLGAVGLLAVPSLRWENLLPPTAKPETMLWGGVEVLSLAGYGIYGMCLPARGKIRKTWGWVTAEAGALSAILFVVVGAFGPALAAGLNQPFIYILRGVGVPGAFQRGEAILAAVLAQADLVLLGLLAKGCRELLTKQNWGSYAVIGAGALMAIILAAWEGGVLRSDKIRVCGGIILGVLVPAFLIWSGRDRCAGRDNTIYCE